MKKKISCIGILGSPRNITAFSIHEILYHWLFKIGYKVFIENTIVSNICLKKPNIGTIEKIGSCCDLAIIIGGDGNMLSAARVLSRYSIKLIGINLGKLGFLADLNQNNMFEELLKILSGEYFLENRFILEVKIYRSSSLLKTSTAVNEVVLHSKKVAHMINFEVYIDKKFAFSQRSDGLIISTLTGSTGYSLSAGGPILDTSLEAILLVPMFPQTLSSRPIVINNRSLVLLKFLDDDNNDFLKISCDSQIVLSLDPADVVLVRKGNNFIKLIHPKSYNYFDVLSKKLHWSKKI
ncbi:NAD kinase [Buchnera aphidicola (Tetraneura ulmi)]|uniref:NAD(+) kinase n=1 Tax=Buchnera aphidicola TaxID=9 RepID=UPI003463E5FF